MNFQDWMAEAIARAGGQSALARKINERFGGVMGKKITPQMIQWLAARNPKDRKPATGSKHLHHIAAVTGLSPDLLTGGPIPTVDGVAQALPTSSSQQREAHELQERYLKALEHQNRTLLRAIEHLLAQAEAQARHEDYEKQHLGRTRSSENRDGQQVRPKRPRRKPAARQRAKE